MLVLMTHVFTEAGRMKRHFVKLNLNILDPGYGYPVGYAGYGPAFGGFGPYLGGFWPGFGGYAPNFA